MTTKTKRRMPPGTKVAYTGKFLRSAGLYTGSAGSEQFEVQECHCPYCTAGSRVAVNQRLIWTDPEDPKYDPEYVRELLAEVGNTWLHISTEALYVVGTLDPRNID